jgi:tetratricopeptide (TPR) repeat protein
MKVQSQTVAEDATAVQIAGDHNTVTITRAGAKLALNRLHRRKADPKTIIELLRADIRATTLVGRETELHDLAEFRSAPAHIAVRCYVGEAGAGKTRLAIEACAAAEAAGWVAGFAPSAELARFHATQNLVHWVLPKDALIVVDYAATSLTVLKEWFASIAPERDSKKGSKLRILLLERQADPQSGWWADLLRRESADRAGPADLIGHDALRLLPPLAGPHNRRALLAETMRLAAPLFDPPTPVLAPSALGTDSWFDERLASDRIDNEPLYLMMAGVHAARHGAPAALALDRVELARHMAGIETARLEKFARSRGFTDDGELLKHLAACVTLQNGAAPISLVAIAEEEMAALGLPTPFGTRTVADRLCNCLSSTNETVAPIQPDLIGEAFLIPIVEGGRFRGEHERRAIVLRAYRRDGTSTVDTLIRCARDFADGSADHPTVQWLRAIVEDSTDVAQLIRVQNLLPRSTLSLREFALDVESRIAAVLRAEADQQPDSINPALAGTLNNLAIRLSGLGRREEALAAAEEARRLYHALFAARPDAFTPNLAMSLNNLANRLSDLGRREEALAAAEEAMRLYRALAAARPDAFRPDLARSLNNLASHLSGLGRREEALAAAEEALRLRRGLAATRPDAFTADLAMSLNTLANRLSKLGRREEALAAAEEAMRLYRALAAARPDAFTPDLAASLNNLANRLSDLGRRGQALAAAEEAVRLYRALAATRPDAFTPNLAMSLNNLANRLSALGRREEALGAAEEAVRLRRALAAARPDAFTPDLAMSLSVLGDMLQASGKIVEAVHMNEEALRLLTPYFLQLPASFAGAIRTYAIDYIRRCELAGREPDPELLEPIATALSRISAPE